MHFGENQLSPSLFGISPLPTAHPTALLRRRVRASTPAGSRGFTLAMGRSLGFGSTPCDLERPLQTRFRCGSGPYTLNPPHGVTRRLLLQ